MEDTDPGNWESAVVSPQTVMGKIKPGMSIFLGDCRGRTANHGPASDDIGC